MTSADLTRRLLPDSAAAPDEAKNAEVYSVPEVGVDECADNEASSPDKTFLLPDVGSQIEELDPGTTVNRYVVLRTLGRGGMGVVYLAFDPELERQVALKLVHVRGKTASSGSNSVEARTRMLREAQAMAKLSHPNVLPVYDVGSYEGSIFMAVEYIEGSTLREWATYQPRTWREIVGVFLAAGRGLAAAHVAGLIHRDFKPPNVMISHDGQVRVMDFGLVRKASGTVETSPSEEQSKTSSIKRGRSSLDVELTANGIFMGTPAYMAPEQHTDASVDARADQFSFCVALYECLYGLRPFPSRRDDMLRACQSARVASPTINLRVPGWIRKLVLRGLSLRPEDRWPSMDALLATLSRDSRKKWRSVAVASSALAVFVVGGTAWGQWKAEQAQMCTGGPAQMEPIWSTETKEQAKAAFLATGVGYGEETWVRVEKLLDGYTTEWLGMHRMSCEATRVRKEQSENLMDLRMRCLQRRLWDVEGLMKAFSLADAKVVERAVEAAGGLTSLAGCADVERLQAQVPPPEDPEVRVRVDDLWQQLAESKALGAAGKTKEGLDSTQSILEEAKILKYGPLEAESWLHLSRLQNDAYDPTAEEAGKRALLVADASKMDEVRAQAAVLLLQTVSNVVQRPQEAQWWGEVAQATIDRLGGNPLLEAELIGGLGQSFRMRGDYVRALELGLRQVAVLEKLGGTDRRLGVGLFLVGTVSRKLGEHDPARAYLERAGEVLEASVGAHHPQFADILLELGRTSLHQGEYARAHIELQRAQTIVETSLGEDSAFFAQILLHHGRVFVREGQYDSAQKYFERALALDLKLLPAHTPQIGYDRTFLGDLYRRQGRYDKAQSELEMAVENLEEEQTNPLLLAQALAGLGTTLLDGGDAPAALEPLERALSIMDSLGKNCRPKELAETRFALGLALWESRRDPNRGHTLVSQARNGFASLGKDQRRDLADSDTWLRQHPAP